MICSMTKPTKWPLRPAKTQISLGICPVWSESSLCTQWVAKDPVFLHADSWAHVHLLVLSCSSSHVFWKKDSKTVRVTRAVSSQSDGTSKPSHITLVEIDHDTVSVATCPLPMIQGQLSTCQFLVKTYEPPHDKTNKMSPPSERSAWATAQSDQSLRCPYEDTLGP